MARYKVVLAYDGTDFSGFQRQANARSVQQEVERALRRVGWEGDSLLGAGRTDAGVHALGQVVAFDFDWGHAAVDLLDALNANLPPDVAGQEIAQTAEDFHPRYDAVSRRYRYRLICRPRRDPVRERHAWRVWPQPHVNRLREAAGFLPGSHDFSAFGTPPKAGGSTVREIFSAEWEAAGDELSFEVAANAYLYHMVRRLVHVQVGVGLGKLEPEAMGAYLRGGFSAPLQGLAPPQGLFLVEVEYPGG